MYELAPVAVTRERNGIGVVGSGMRLSFHYILLSHEFISDPSIKHTFIPFIHSFIHLEMFIELCCVPSTVLGARAVAVNEITNPLSL